MSDRFFMGYKVNTGIKHFLPNTVLFTKNDEKITVAMAQEAVDYILGVLAHKNPLIDTYKKAKAVFSAIKLILENKQPAKVTKEDAKVAIDVLKEILNKTAKSEAEKGYNARCALLCKLLIDGFGGGYGMSKWEEKRLEDIIDINPPVKLKKGEPYPFIDIDKVSPTRRSVTNDEVKIYDGQSSSKFCDGDTIFSRITPCLENRKIAKVAIDGDVAFGSTEFYVFRGKKKKADARFTYYLISSDAVVLPAINSMTGASGRQRADKRFIQRLKLNLPDLPTQKCIADVLSAYDDLIEANNRRIELLEQIAQELYKEWFVRFRFPGHENNEFENGLPEGWERNKIQKYYHTCSGGTPSRNKPEYFENGIYPWVKTGEIKDCVIIDTEEYITKEAVNCSSAKVLPAKSVAMAMYGVNIGLLAYFDSEMTCNQACCVFSDKRNFSSKHYLYHYLKSIREYLLLISFGAAQQNLSQDLIKKIKITMPSDDVVQTFEKKIDDIYDNIKMLLMKNKNLATQRDMLLPRLMSGKLEV